jgi:copper homeostasis protein
MGKQYLPTQQGTQNNLNQNCGSKYSKMIVEVCANSFESAVNAEKAGTDRIELCSELAVGGVTPSYGLLKAVRKALDIPVHVLIRPRGADFSYSDAEFGIMKEDVLLCQEIGIDGIVSGVLHPDFTLDVERTQTLIEASGNMKFTFHRAFDWVLDPLEVFSQLDAMGADYVLSSGQRFSAPEGLALLSELNRNDAKCAIMPGGGINIGNVKQFKERGFRAIHLSGSRFETRLSKRPKISMNAPKFLNDEKIAVSHIATIKEIIKAVK